MIFRTYRISITDEEPKRPLQHTDAYNLAPLKRMGFQKVNGVWVRMGEQSEDIDISEDLRQTKDEIPRVSSPVLPSAPQIEQASSCIL